MHILIFWKHNVHEENSAGHYLSIRQINGINFWNNERWVMGLLILKNMLKVSESHPPKLRENQVLPWPL